MGLTKWWQFGLVGGLTLFVATGIKLVRAVARGSVGQPDELAEAAVTAAAMLGTGFACGVLVWAGRKLYDHIGMAGDALVGLVVMVVFFVCCMTLFEPEMLGERFDRAGRPMLLLAAVVGPVVGAWWGRDFRREFGGPPAGNDDRSLL